MTIRYLAAFIICLSASLASGENAPLIQHSDESKFDIPLDQFSIDINWLGDKTIPMFISISKGSLTYRQFPEGNKLPQLILSINMQQAKGTHLRYLGQSYLPEKKRDHHLYLTVDVFSPDPVEILHNGKLLGHIVVQANPNYFKHRYLYVDHSCSPYHIMMDDTEDLFTSIACRFYANKQRRGILELKYLPAESRLKDGSQPPYQIQLTGQANAQLPLRRKGKDFSVHLKAKVPDYVPRFKTALGYGPYYFKTRKGEQRNKEHLTASYMIYGRYDLTETTSLRFFDALLNSGSIFNNAGGYFAYEVGSTDDKRLTVIPLLGFQSISVKTSNDDQMIHQSLFPQGGELVYRHAFNMRNYSLIYGMFLSTSNKVNYKNIWVRFGKSFFWELNWIHWEYEEREAGMWGLSVGLPFLSF